MAQGPMPAPGIGTPDWEQQMRGIWDRTRGQQPPGVQMAAGANATMPGMAIGDTVKVLDMNKPGRTAVIIGPGLQMGTVRIQNPGGSEQLIAEDMLRAIAPRP